MVFYGRFGGTVPYSRNLLINWRIRSWRFGRKPARPRARLRAAPLPPAPHHRNRTAHKTAERGAPSRRPREARRRSAPRASGVESVIAAELDHRRQDRRRRRCPHRRPLQGRRAGGRQFPHRRRAPVWKARCAPAWSWSAASCKAISMRPSRSTCSATGVIVGDVKAASITVAAGSRMRGHVEFGWDDKHSDAARWNSRGLDALGMSTHPLRFAGCDAGLPALQGDRAGKRGGVSGLPAPPALRRSRADARGWRRLLRAQCRGHHRAQPRPANRASTAWCSMSAMSAASRSRARWWGSGVLQSGELRRLNVSVEMLPVSAHAVRSKAAAAASSRPRVAASTAARLRRRAARQAAPVPATARPSQARAAPITSTRRTASDAPARLQPRASANRA